MIRLLAPRCDRATVGRMRDDGTDPEHGTHTRAGESRTIGFVLSPKPSAHDWFGDDPITRADDVGVAQCHERAHQLA